MNPPIYDGTWSDDVKALYKHDVQEIWDWSIHPHIWNQYHNQLKIYMSLAGRANRPLRILDVGCAQATLALMLAERGHRVVALDLRPQFLEYARSRYSSGEIKFVAANIFDAKFDDRFDLVFANQIIEHLVRPAEFLRRLLSFLDDDGRVIITTPNWAYVMNNLPTFSGLGDVAKYEHRQFTADGDGHFFAYTGSELAKCLLEAGFADVRLTCFETPFISGHMKLRYVHRYLPSGVLALMDRAVLALPVVGERLAHQILATGRAARAAG